jgi:uncharacterized protein
MDPALAYVELGSGRLLGEARPPADLRRLSVRHLAVLAGGRLAVGMQWEGDPEAGVPLVGLADGSGLHLLEAPPEVVPAMAAYVGSVAADGSGRLVAASCPRGGIVTFWDATAGGRFAGSAPLPDGCGVAPDAAPGRFALSSGTGVTATAGAPDWRPAGLAGTPGHLAWDNHLTRRLG